MIENNSHWDRAVRGITISALEELFASELRYHGTAVKPSWWEIICAGNYRMYERISMVMQVSTTEGVQIPTEVVQVQQHRWNYREGFAGFDMRVTYVEVKKLGIRLQMGEDVSHFVVMRKGKVNAGSKLADPDTRLDFLKETSRFANQQYGQLSTHRPVDLEKYCLQIVS